jgi:hypothetical protein
MECAACPLAELPKPPMREFVASLWDSRQEIDDAAAWPWRVVGYFKPAARGLVWGASTQASAPRNPFNMQICILICRRVRQLADPEPRPIWGEGASSEALSLPLR